MDRLSPTDVAAVAARLRAAGCVAADDEASELIEAAAVGVGDLDRLVQRRCAGEPLAWITGTVTFCGLTLHIAPGVYVPRWQTEALARAAARVLPARGVAVDLCTGCGAVAALLRSTRPEATVVAGDVVPAAVQCARDNGVDASEGDLFEPLPLELRGRVDVITAVTPYVPTAEVGRLAPTLEPRLALDGGADGLAIARRVVEGVREWLVPRGHLLLEIGAPQEELARTMLLDAGFTTVVTLHDPDGDVAGIHATR